MDSSASCMTLRRDPDTHRRDALTQSGPRGSEGSSAHCLRLTSLRSPVLSMHLTRCWIVILYRWLYLHFHTYGFLLV